MGNNVVAACKNRKNVTGAVTEISRKAIAINWAMEVPLISFTFSVLSLGKRKVEGVSESYEAADKMMVWYIVVDERFEAVGMKREIEICSTATIKDLFETWLRRMPWMQDFAHAAAVFPNSSEERIPAFRLVRDYRSTMPLRLFIPYERSVILGNMKGGAAGGDGGSGGAVHGGGAVMAAEGPANTSIRNSAGTPAILCTHICTTLI